MQNDELNEHSRRDKTVYFCKLSLAGKNVEIESTNKRILFPFKEYLTHFDHPDIVIKAIDTDCISGSIGVQPANASTSDQNAGIATEYIGMESLAILNELAKEMLNYQVLLMHGSAIAVNNNSSFIFTAPSGTGKTTHTRLWLDHLPDAFVVNGDKTFIKFPEEGFQPLACGSPWAGKENMYTNTMVPLKAVVLMERAEENHMEQISFARAFPFLLQQTYRPNDEVKMRKTLCLLQQLSTAVPFWRFQCNNFKDDCFDVAYNALVGKQL